MYFDVIDLEVLAVDFFLKIDSLLMTIVVHAFDVGVYEDGCFSVGDDVPLADQSKRLQGV